MSAPIPRPSVGCPNTYRATSPAMTTKAPFHPHTRRLCSPTATASMRATRPRLMACMNTPAFTVSMTAPRAGGANTCTNTNRAPTGRWNHTKKLSHLVPRAGGLMGLRWGSSCPGRRADAGLGPKVPRNVLGSLACSSAYPHVSEKHPADYTAKQGDKGGWLGASGLLARHPEDEFFPGRAHHIGKRGLFQAKPEHAPRPTVRPVVDGNEDRTRMRRVVDRTRHSPGLRHRQDLDGDQSRFVGVIEIAQVEDASLAAVEHDLEHVKAALEHLMNPVFPGPM